MVLFLYFHPFWDSFPSNLRPSILEILENISPKMTLFVCNLPSLQCFFPHLPQLKVDGTELWNTLCKTPNLLFPQIDSRLTFLYYSIVVARLNMSLGRKRVDYKD